MLSMIITALIGAQTAIGSVATPIICQGSLEPTTSANGKDDHASQISSRFALYATVSRANQFVAVEYQTYGGKEYIQFPGLFPSSLFPFHGSVYGALQDAVKRTGTRQPLPAPYNQVKEHTPISRGACL